MLGLRRGTVRLDPHHPGWADRFSEVKAGLLEATGLPAERIEHVGSTAVPDLPAKPILDVDLGMREADDLEALVARLVEIGFIDRGTGEGGIGRLLVRESAPEVRTVHVHLIPHGSSWWRSDLAFRDALREHPRLRERYARLKADLTRRYPEDRKAYRNAKAPFIREALRNLGLEG